MRYILLLLTMVIAVVAVAQPSGSIIGKVFDSETKKPLEGTNILLQGTTTGTSSGRDGSFVISAIPAGKYTLSVSYVGYEVKKQSVSIGEGQRVSLEIFLKPTILPGQTVVVTATRAKERETPVAFSNLDAQQISQRYWAQDVPMMLSELPNVYAYSDNGNGIGYSYMRMRGFGQNRIAVMLNGVPLNDAESHEVFWVDLPDFAASTEDIQVQRGVGRSLYGASAFGGSVNLVTNQRVRKPGIEVSLGRGSYNTQRYSVAGYSGLSENTYSIYGRFSRIETDGYRQPSWSKLWSYFIGVSRFDETMTTRLNVFGGVEQSYLSYLGVPKKDIDDKSRRRINPFQYPDEVDNFYQPHFQLLNEWQISSNVKVENTLFTFLGFGHYTQFRVRRDVREYKIARFSVADSTLLPANYYDVDANGKPRRRADGLFQVRRLDFVRKRLVDDLDFGWLPRVTILSENGEWVFGGEFRQHKGQHWGEVSWANLLPPGITPNWRYYDYRVPKTSLSLYAHRLYRINEDIAVSGDVQYTRHVLKLNDERNYQVEFNRTYNFLNPRAGINYNISPEFNAYLNFSVAQREPAFKSIYNPQDYWSNPINLPKNFQKTATGYTFEGKEVKPEKFFHIEFGSGYKTEIAALKLNLYWMDFRDEIIASGQIDDNGVPITGNAERSVHRGIELEGSIQLLPDFNLSGNIALNDDRFIRYTEYVVVDWSTSPPKTAAVVLDDNRLGGFPDILANARGEYRLGNLTVGLHLRHQGKIYLDNTERKDFSIDPVTILNASVRYNLGNILGLRSVEVRVTMNNLTNKLYAAAGYVDTEVPYFIPAAERNFFASLKVEL